MAMLEELTRSPGQNKIAAMQSPQRKKKSTARRQKITLGATEDAIALISRWEFPGDSSAETVERIMRALALAICSESCPPIPPDVTGSPSRSVSFYMGLKTAAMMEQYSGCAKNQSRLMLRLIKWAESLKPPVPIQGQEEFEAFLWGLSKDRVLAEEFLDGVGDRASKKSAIEFLLKAKERGKVLLVDRVPSPTPRVLMGKKRVYAIVLLSDPRNPDPRSPAVDPRNP